MTERRVDVVIVGGGVTGLAAAFALSQRSERPPDWLLLEGSDRLGGNLRTERVGGFLIDAGPDGFVRSKPSAERLCRAVGLGDELIETRPENRRVYVLHRGRLEPLPDGMHLVAPTRLLPFVRSPVLSLRGKLRVGLELAIPRARGEQDESIGAFVRRRLGREASELLAESLLAGIHAGDPEALSVRATFPQLVGYEREHGGLIRGALAARRRAPGRDPGAPLPSAFLSLREGMSALPKALGDHLDAQRVYTSRAVTGLSRSGDRWRVTSSRGEAIAARALVLAIPPRSAAQLLSTVDPSSSAMLGEVPQLSTATVFLAFDRRAVPHPMDATGFLVPPREARPITASTWVSSKWPGRAPEGTVLLRVFFGGARDPHAASRGDDELARVAREQIADVLGVKASPLLQRVYRYLDASPQMRVGHAALMARVRARLDPLRSLYVTGAGYDGVGVPDSISQGEATARAVLSDLPHV